MTRLVRWGALPLLAAPAGVWAVGLGDIQLRSALNQPFQADIQLLSATTDEVAALRVNLAARDTFERYGLERPSFLSGLEFRVVRDASGRDVIRVTSREAVTEPFVTMLVEATWPRGRLLREYTVLLDPPVLLPQPAVAAAVQEAQTRPAQPAPAAGGTLPRPQPAATPAATAGSTPTMPAPARAPAAGTVYGPVQRAETLWGIAEQLRPGDLTMNQVMVALYEANPDAFLGNMNVLRQGATLRIPTADEMRRLTVSAATVEVQRQNDAWQSLAPQQARLRLLPPSVDSPSALASAAGGSALAAADTGAAALQAEVTTLRAELAESRRLLELRDAELQALQARLAGVDAVPAATTLPTSEGALGTDPGVDLAPEPLFADEAEVDIESASADQTAEPLVETMEEVEQPPAATVAPVAAPPAAAPRVVSTPPEPSLLAQVLGFLANPFALMGLGVVALLGGAGWFVRRRREHVEDITGRWDALEAEVDSSGLFPSGDTEKLSRKGFGDQGLVVEEEAPTPARSTALDAAKPRRKPSPQEFEPEATLSNQTVINLDQADVVAEADFHIAYGLYDQAAELLAKAIEAQPDRNDLKLKQLEVFFVWGNKDAFLDAARQLRTEMGDGADRDWDKVVIMGKQICPGEALFAQAAALGDRVDLDLAEGDAPALDFSFDDRSLEGDASDVASELDLDLGFGADGATDIDLDAGEQGYTMDPAPANEDDSIVEDVDLLDIGERTAAGLEAALLMDDDEERHDPSAMTTPGWHDDDAVTQESPTIESPTSVGHSGMDETMESPTLGMTSLADAPTVETPTVEMQGRPTPDAETPEGTTELPTIEQPVLTKDTDHTEEIDLDDLGLELDDLGDLPEGLGATAMSSRQRALEDTDYAALLSATGVTQVLQEDEAAAGIGENDATMLAPSYDEDTLSGTEVLNKITDVEGNADGDGTARFAMHGEHGLDLNLEDLSAALDDAETIEQPGRRGGFGDIFGGTSDTPLDLDVGAEYAHDDEPTGTEEMSPLDPQTMTEVGTKLDLARAYIDMGDPEGARSILEEVLGEGDASQRREAQSLIDVLSA